MLTTTGRATMLAAEVGAYRGSTWVAAAAVPGVTAETVCGAGTATDTEVVADGTGADGIISRYTTTSSSTTVVAVKLATRPRSVAAEEGAVTIAAAGAATTNIRATSENVSATTAELTMAAAVGVTMEAAAALVAAAAAVSESTPGSETTGPTTSEMTWTSTMTAWRVERICTRYSVLTILI